MKWFLICWLLAGSMALAQKEPVFGLDVTVHYLRTRKPVQNAPVIVSDTAGTVLFEGCTDASGSLSIDSSVIRPEATYEIRLDEMSGFYNPGWGTLIATEGLEVSERLKVDLFPSVLSECWYFSCYEPGRTVSSAQLDTVVADVTKSIPAFEQEFGITTTRLAVWIHYETWDREKQLMKQARHLRRHLRRAFPDLKVEHEVQIEYHPDHRHEGCLRVVRLG